MNRLLVFSPRLGRHRFGGDGSIPVGGGGARAVQSLLGWAPDLPQSVPSAVMPTSFGTEWFVADLASFLNAVTNSVTGDLITVDHTAPRIQGPANQELAWPVKAGAGPGNYVTIRTDAWASLPSLPASGVAPTLLAGGSNNPRVGLADQAVLGKFRAGAGAPGHPVGSRPFLRMRPGSGGLYLWGVDLDCAPGATEANQITGLMRLGETTNDPQEDAQWHFAALTDIVHDVVVQQCYIHSNADGTFGNPSNYHSCSKALYTACTRLAIVNSTLVAEHTGNGDCNAIAILGGRGITLIDNNLLAANGENLLIGGQDLPSYYAGIIPSDHTWTRNHAYKPDVWLPGTPGYGGTSYPAKNPWEIKYGVRILMDGNLLDGNVGSGQSGQGLSIKVSNQSQTMAWAETGHLTIRRNLTRRVGSGYVYSMLESGPCSAGGGIPPHHVAAYDNLTDFSDTSYSGTNRGMYFGAGCLYSAGRSADSHHIAHVNETFLGRSTSVDMLVDWGTGPCTQFTMDSCVFTDASLNIKAGSISEGDASLDKGTDSATASVTRNALIGTTSTVLPGHPGNYFPSSNLVAGLNADGSLTVGSPMRAGGAMDSWDGSDNGCDLARVAAATAGVDLSP